MSRSSLKKFIARESNSSIILFIGAALGLIIANSPFQNTYYTFFHQSYLFITPNLIINEGLMSLFFLLVTLEIKREFLSGELSSKKTALLPAIAATGGILVPALIYIAINHGQTINLRGWAIPVATDIAFALAVLNSVGSRIPNGLKIFLTALAILDDLVAIVIIAIFYTEKLHYLFLLLTLFLLLSLFVLKKRSVITIWPYLFLGIALWLCVFRSGIHATISGVLLGALIPNKDIEEKLHPFVAYLILPVFAFANSGLHLSNINTHFLLNPITLGILLGLFCGKCLGVFSFSLFSTKLGLTHLPALVTKKQLFGVSLLCGIGFTMSLFIGNLAFGHLNALYVETVKAGVLIGSLLAGISGYLILRK